MSISSVSSAAGQVSLAQQVSLAVTKLSMNVAIDSGDPLRIMMEQSVNPNLGQTIDLKP
jgi:hypothetical protein